MIYAILAAVTALAVGLWQLRFMRLARNPAAWPRSLSFGAQVKLAKAFLRHEGWKLYEAHPAMNIFVRAQRNGLWLTMMIHSEGTLSLPTLMLDCVSKHAGNGIILGILSQDVLPRALLDDAERNGIYIVNPTELKNIDEKIRQIASRRRKQKIEEANERSETFESDVVATTSAP